LGKEKINEYPGKGICGTKIKEKKRDNCVL
jgi:hypothetical protein